MVEQLSLFNELDAEELLPPDRQLLRKELRRGSGFEGGKPRILEASRLEKKDFIEFLKKEFGTGGWSGPSIASVFFSPKGYTINWYKEDERNYSWSQIADEILDMIRTSLY